MKRYVGAGLLPVIAAAVLGMHANAARGEEARLELQPAAVEEEVKTLPELVDDYKAGFTLDEQGECLAKAVYFEARSESLEGQLAVADVVLNRAASNLYPSSWCRVVTQRAQFSFIRGGKFPHVRDNESWETAKAVARIAIDDAAEVVPDEVLWYHADYVRPVWRHNLNQVAKVGVHIFYGA